MQTVDITIAQGVVQNIDLPPGIRAIVRDYDIEGGTSNGFDIRKDGCGAEYHRIEICGQEDCPTGSNLLLIDIGRIDWIMLRAQKEVLREARDRLLSRDIESPCGEALSGLLHLIDHVQDQVADSVGEQTVFGEVPQSDDSDVTKGG